MLKPSTIEEIDLVMQIVEAAEALRDLDWNTADPGGPLDRLDKAVDAWRKYLRRKTKEKNDGV